MKRKTKIILIIISVILLAVGVYFGIRYLTSPSTTPPVSDTSTTTDVSDNIDQSDQEDQDQDTSEQTEENNVPVLLSDEEKQVFDFWINPSNEDVNYITLSGNIYSAKEGPDPEISTQGISALNFIKQSPSGDFILTAFGDPKSPQWGIFDVIDQVWRPLPSSVNKATWVNENELVVIRENSGQRTLEVVELQDGSISEASFSQNIIFNDFRMRDIKMNVLDNNRLMVHEKPASFYESRLWEINLDESSISTLIGKENGLSINWTENYAFKFNSPDNFFILNHSIENVFPVLFTTLPSKCGEGSNIIVCGVPQNNLEGDESIPESYFQKEIFTVDNFNKLNPSSLETNVIFKSGVEDINPMDIKNPRVSNGTAYFLNRYNNGLYKVEL